MDEYLLNDLLECSVCLERLDTSSKVLPCQHTFCKKCLEEIVSTKKELRCPECRVLVTTSIDELPPNVLLMRILEGMRHAGNPLPKKRTVPVLRQTPAATVFPTSPPTAQPLHTTVETPTPKPHTAPKPSVGPGQPMARALYDYQSLEPEDLCFKKGELITLRTKIDAHWAQGECGGRIGIFPLTFVQILTPLPPQVATCRALYDFRMNNDEVEGCLSFRKDDVLAVLRRVDENWVEGRTGGRIGIFPLAFVELNPIAKALIKLSSNEQPGPSRLAPPTPTSDESTPLIPTNSRADDAQGIAHEPNRLILSPTLAAPLCASPPSTAAPSTASVTLVTGRTNNPESNSSTSTTTPNSSGSSSTSSSSSSTAPSSPASPQQPVSAQPLNPFMRPQTILLPTSHITTQQARDKRHSFTAITPSQPPPPPTNRHSAEILSASEPSQESTGGQTASGQTPKEENGQNASTSRDGASGLPRESASGLTKENSAGPQASTQLVRHGSQRHRRSGSDFALVHLPATYVALYPYKPHKADELELKKGGVYLVTERCQDGWFKGTSNRTQKCGVFPGNYVTLAKPAQNTHSRVVSSSPRDSSAPSPLATKARSSSILRQAAPSALNCLAPPELPPRASSPAPRLHRYAWTFPTPPPSESSTAELPPGAPPAVPNKIEMTPRHGSQVPSAGPAKVDLTPRHATPSKVDLTPRHGSHVSNTVSPPPNVSVSLSPISTKPADKVKEKKEKSGLMKRLAAIKRSRSPTVPAYSMDNPVFEDSSHQPTILIPSTVHSAHSRSGSCPSQLMQLPSHMSTSLSARVTRHKERPSVAAAQFAHAQVSRAADSGSPLTASHRKSSSLDAGDPRNPKHLVPSVRERFRCIVPYPPNSEYELELRVGDIIYVHRKRDDGWYKGTQQRTGRTGLFPASFVETF